jgi:6,7-dimethyl-8-ribityllumazine synthase
MAGALPKQPSDFLKIPNAKVAIVASSWHREIVNEMILSAITELRSIGVAEGDIMLCWAPGSHELPLYAKFPDLDGIIAFGVVLRGGTTHNDSVIQAAVNGFINLNSEFSKPIINEVIGVNKIEDAESRAKDKGIEAVYAFSECVCFLRDLNA